MRTITDEQLKELIEEAFDMGMQTISDAIVAMINDRKKRMTPSPNHSNDGGGGDE